MDFNVHTELEIEASAEAVWAALTSQGKRPWDPVMRRFNADLKPGGKADIFLKIGVLPTPIKGRISRCEEGKELAWKGGVPLVMKAEHGFRIEPISESKVRFVHYENFSGTLLFLLMPVLRNLPKHYSRMNEAIRNKATGQVR